MRSTQPKPPRCISLTLLGVALSLAPLPAWADTVWLGETAKNPIPAEGVTINEIKGDSLSYTNLGGIQQIKPLSQIQKIMVVGEPAFNAAEELYSTGKIAESVDGYQQAVRSSGKQAVKDRAVYRLLEVASKSNRFDAAVTAYVALVGKDPAKAEKLKPVLTDPNAPNLDTAAADITTALSLPKITDTQRVPLLSLLLDIYRAKKDSTNAAQTVQQLANLGAAKPVDLAQLKLASARTAMDAKDFAKASAEVQQNKALFTDPAAQVEALFILARARDEADGESDKPDVLKDIAIAYIRSATFGKDVPGQPHVAESLLHAAQIEEKLKEPQVARGIYQQIAKEYADQPAATDAGAAADRLGKGS